MLVELVVEVVVGVSGALWLQECLPFLSLGFSACMHLLLPSPFFSFVTPPLLPTDSLSTPRSPVHQQVIGSTVTLMLLTDCNVCFLFIISQLGVICLQ